MHISLVDQSNHSQEEAPYRQRYRLAGIISLTHSDATVGIPSIYLHENCNIWEIHYFGLVCEYSECNNGLIYIGLHKLLVPLQKNTMWAEIGNT